jgi:hypothetical protein
MGVPAAQGVRPMFWLKLMQCLFSAIVLLEQVQEQMGGFFPFSLYFSGFTVALKVSV